MNRIRAIILAAALAAASLSQGFAQDHSSASFGLDPSDAQALKEIRRRSARIHRQRPVVALVLSGGGAKGAAHVGVLEVIEQYDIPIDMIVGTSVGGMIGGFYAAGCSLDRIKELIVNADWDVMLTDAVPRKYIPYSRKEYNDTYALRVPFYYGHGGGDEEWEMSGRRRGDDGKLHIGASSGRESKMSARDNLMKSLPSGLVFGQNVDYAISSMLAGYSDDMSFWDLPIPFACVATDLISGKAKVWHSGNLHTALRSTMSIPGLFTPVRTDGMVLVDGGMRNNFPVDIAKEMGADIVIGVDLSTDDPSDIEEVSNILGMVVKGIEMFAADSFQRNVDAVDLRINPDLAGYNMMSFNAEALDTMYNRGLAAARAQAENLAAIKRRTGSSGRKLSKSASADITSGSIVLEGVDVSGVTGEEARIIISKLPFSAGDRVCKRDLEDAVSAIYGAGNYEYVRYDITGKDPYRLLLTCRKAPINRIGLGFRVDSQDLVSLLLNVGLNTNSISGSSLDLTSRIGVNPYIRLHYIYNRHDLPTLNLTASAAWAGSNSIRADSYRYDISFFSTTQEAYLSNLDWAVLDVKAGIRNRYFNITNVMTNTIVGDYTGVIKAMDYPSAFVSGRVETLNDKYFPTSGSSAGIGYELVSRIADGEEFPPFFGILTVDGKLPVSFGSSFTVIPSVSSRMVFGDDVPLPYANVIGGQIPGRYVFHQIPFVGINDAAIRRRGLVAVQSDFRLRLVPDNYLTLTGGYAYDFDGFGNFEDGDGIWGVSLGYAYDTVVGPIKASLSWSSMTKFGVYISIGFDF